MNDQLTEVYASIDALIDYALAHLDLDPRNADWTRNQIFALFRLDSYPGPKTTTSAASVSDVVQDIVGSRSQAPYGEKTVEVPFEMPEDRCSVPGRRPESRS